MPEKSREDHMVTLLCSDSDLDCVLNQQRIRANKEQRADSDLSGEQQMGGAVTCPLSFVSSKRAKSMPANARFVVLFGELRSLKSRVTGPRKQSLSKVIPFFP